MNRGPTLATLKALAAADDGWYGSTDGEPPPGFDEASKAHFRALRAYRIERGTQRPTKAEVDAQIAERIRGWADEVFGLTIGPARVAMLQALCNERNADSGPAGAAAKESREDIAAPEGAPIPTPRHGCPCGASFPTAAELALHQDEGFARGGCREWKPNDQPKPGTAPGGTEARTPGQPARCSATAPEDSEPPRGGSAEPAECEWCQDASHPPLYRYFTPAAVVRVCGRCLDAHREREQGKRGAPAAPEEAHPHPDDRPCGCEETEALRGERDALKAQLANIRRMARCSVMQSLFEEIDREP